MTSNDGTTAHTTSTAIKASPFSIVILTILTLVDIITNPAMAALAHDDVPFVLEVDEWLTKKEPDPSAKLHVALVFQTNCPGCFQHALPLLLGMKKAYPDVSFFAIATAFEDFDFNTLENARKLIETGEVFGETKMKIGKCDLPLRELAIAFDKLRQPTPDAVAKQAAVLLKSMKIQHDGLAVSDDVALERLSHSLKQRRFLASTFDSNGLLGTPSWILFHPTTKIIYHQVFGHLDFTSFQDLLNDALRHEASNSTLVDTLPPLPQSAYQMYLEEKQKQKAAETSPQEQIAPPTEEMNLSE